VPPDRVEWTESDICACFDDAFRHLFAGDFVSAAACFQRAIDESGRADACYIAKRDLEWWCLPLESMVAKLKDTRRAWTLTELITECLGPETPSEYRQQVSDSLHKIATICCLSDQLWVHKSCFETAVRLILTRFREHNSPTTLSEIAYRLLTQLGCHGTAPSKQVLNSLNTQLGNISGIVVVRDGCIFDEAHLHSFRSVLIELIKERKKPVRLREVVDRMLWSHSVKAALQPTALREWLHSQRGHRENPSELGGEWWFISGLLDLSTAPMDEVFRDRFDTLATEIIVLRYLFGGSKQKVSSVERLAQAASKQLARNPSLMAVEDGRWFLAKTVNDLVGGMVDHLGEHSHPVGIEELLKAVRPPGQRRFFIPDSVLTFLAACRREQTSPQAGLMVN
jgi:hypothetical protein